MIYIILYLCISIHTNRCIRFLGVHLDAESDTLTTWWIGYGARPPIWSSLPQVSLLIKTMSIHNNIQSIHPTNQLPSSLATTHLPTSPSRHPPWHRRSYSAHRATTSRPPSVRRSCWGHGAPPVLRFCAFRFLFERVLFVFFLCFFFLFAVVVLVGFCCFFDVFFSCFFLVCGRRLGRSLLFFVF